MGYFDRNTPNLGFYLIWGIFLPKHPKFRIYTPTVIFDLNTSKSGVLP